MRISVVVCVWWAIALPAHAGALHEAARDGDIEAVQQLIVQGEDVNQRHRFLGTPLHQAATSGHVEIARVLLSAGANPNADIPVFGQPLSMAASKGHRSVVELLLASGADVSARGANGKTALHTAAEGGHVDIVELLVIGGADVNARSSERRACSAAHYAGIYARFHVIDLLRALGWVNRTSQPASHFIATADPESGEQLFRHHCIACHSFRMGEENRAGPNLWAVLDRNKSSVEGFEYSAAFERLSGQWTISELNAFLAAPCDYVPGTKMVFHGIGDVTERADLIAFLQNNGTDGQ